MYNEKNFRASDVSFVSNDWLKKSQRDFGQLLPGLMVEIKAKSYRLKPLVEKIQQFLELGTTVRILIDLNSLRS
ncbi:Uma2 family endonuclease [Nostoc sp. 106C]|uniref:Uma2 family endonuclease n=1 Tax=Nostoc sp. 106C TaxID=1932667 RepID=UPI002441C358|nr:Uma2 family endonuclease [Nostoc sp. 106C]